MLNRGLCAHPKLGNFIVLFCEIDAEDDEEEKGEEDMFKEGMMKYTIKYNQAGEGTVQTRIEEEAVQGSFIERANEGQVELSHSSYCHGECQWDCGL